MVHSVQVGVPFENDDVVWPTVSERCAELIRRGAALGADPPAEWLEELHDASLGGDLMRPIRSDPVLAESVRRSNLTNLMHWVAFNLQEPGVRVPPTMDTVALTTARDLVRRDLDSVALDAYRKGQAVAWRYWMNICFTLTDDAAELRELFEVSMLSISTYLDDCIAALASFMDAEREQLTRGTNAERLATVNLLLQGAPVSPTQAESKLGYRLEGTHTAAVVWGRADTSSRHLEDTAEALMSAAGVDRRLTVIANAATLWVWLPGAADAEPVALAGAAARHGDVQVALGRPGSGVDGFRRTHLDATATQQVLHQARPARQFATYDDVQLVAVLGQNPARAREFVEATLGPLATADPELQRVLLHYLREGCNVSRTATRLYTHRNTVLRRLQRAEELLPRPLADQVVAVGAALELLAWGVG